jgi:chemotaxis protein CheX
MAFEIPREALPLTTTSSELVEAFTQATRIALEELTRSWPMPLPAFCLVGAWRGGDLFASLKLDKQPPGELLLVMPTAVLEELARRYLGEEEPATPELLDDVAGEFANVIAGQAKTMLQGTPYHYTISTPKVYRSYPQIAAGRTYVILPFEVDAGIFVVQVALSDGPQ